jgi:hypothetical protein
LGEPYYAESVLPKGYKTIIDWFQEVGLDPNYANPKLQRFDVEEGDDEEPKPLKGGIELNRIEEINDGEESKLGDKLKVGGETKVECAKGDENKKPAEKTS